MKHDAIKVNYIHFLPPPPSFTGVRESKFPGVWREGFNERREFILDLPKRTESRLLEGFGATSESYGSRRVYVDYVGDYVSEDLINHKGLVEHDGAGRS